MHLDFCPYRADVQILGLRIFIYNKTHVLRVQRCPQSDLSLSAGGQQIEEVDQRLAGGRRDLLGQLGHVDRVLVVIRFVVRLAGMDTQNTEHDV